MQSLPETKVPQRALRGCAGTLLEVLPDLMRFVRRQMRSRRARGLSVPQFRTLVQLRRRPAASLSSISEGMGSSPPTTCRIISVLVRKGLITRKTSRQDRRRVTLHLTPRGRQVIDRAWTGTEAALAEKLAELRMGELAGMSRSLTLLRTVFPTNGVDED